MRYRLENETEAERFFREWFGNPVAIFGALALCAIMIGQLVGFLWQLYPPTFVLNQVETQRINLRDAFIGGAVVHHTGVPEADQSFNKIYAKWFPERWEILRKAGRVS